MKRNKQNVGKAEKTFLDNIEEEDRFSFDFRDEDKMWIGIKFMIFIVSIRCRLISQGVRLKFVRFFDGERAVTKGHCPSSSIASLFLVVTLTYYGKHPVELLIYKHNVYMLGIKKLGEWLVVDDFEIHTGFEPLPIMKRLQFLSSYRSTIPSRFGFYLVKDAILNLNGWSNVEQNFDIEPYFKMLCVVLSECVRFDSVLKEICGCLVCFLSEKGKGTVEKDLSKEVLAQIHNWKDLTELWFWCATGYEWNFQGLIDLGVENLVECEQALGLLAFLSEEDKAKMDRTLKKRQTELGRSLRRDE